MSTESGSKQPRSSAAARGSQTAGRSFRSSVRRAVASGIAAGTALLLIVSGLLAPPAFAASLSEQRAALRQVQYSAAQDYVASRDYVSKLARANGLIIKNAIASGLELLKVVGSELTLASTQSAMDAVAVKMNAEALRAATVKKGGQQLITLKDLRTKQQVVAKTALADFVAGRVTPLQYEEAKARTGSFSTQLSADTSRQLGAVGQPVPAPGLASPAYVAVLEQATGTIPTAPGLIGVPGGCALPAASPGFRPVLPADGPGIATNRQIVQESLAGAAADPDTGAVHRQLLRAASNEAAVQMDLDALRSAYVMRVPRLGYGWLSGNDVKARDVLAADTQRVLLAGPEGMSTLASSHLLLAAAGAADWVKLTGMDETVLVRWLGPQTCLLEDRDNYIKGPTNLGAIHNAASFTATAVFLKLWPELAAALAQASLTSIQPALKMITTDGGTQEGPGYWTYQSRAIAILYATLPNAYANLPVVMPTLEKVSNYAMNSTGPDGMPSPFADAEPKELSGLMPAWDARVRRDASVAAWVAGRFAQKPDAYLMWWRIPPGALPAKQSTVYPHTGLAALHTPGSTATLKGGSNGANHAHLDLGTFSFYRKGVEWSVDPGPMPAGTVGYYSESQRLSYWNPGTSAHSTLAYTNVNQPATAVAAVRRISSSTASVDLRQALPGTSTATRTVTHGSTSMIVKDVIRTDVARDLTWQWITDATVSLGTNRAVLRRDGQSIVVALSGVPAGATLTAEPAPGTTTDGRALTILKLTMPQVRSLDLAATAY